MSEEQLKAFLEKVKSDTELQEKLKSVTSAEAAIEVAKDSGFSITLEDIQTLQSEASEISDQELENAAGGTILVGGIMASAIACGMVVSMTLECLD